MFDRHKGLKMLDYSCPHIFGRNPSGDHPMKEKLFLPDNIRDDFSLCHGDTAAKHLVASLFEALNEDKICESTQLAMKEWAVLFRLSENNEGPNTDILKRRKALEDIFARTVPDCNSEFKALYALQTGYSMIVRMIAVKLVPEITYKKKRILFKDLLSFSHEGLRSFMHDLEEGKDLYLCGIGNLTEGDFFSWYSFKDQWNTDIYDSLIAIIRCIDEYSPVTDGSALNAIDIFRELYMELMPNAVRHSLGEYYTPSWLADHVVKNSLKQLDKNWTALDPCCGSGVFITRLISAIYNGSGIAHSKSVKKKELLIRINKSVKGIDINPISVLTARVTYFIALLPLLKETGMQINIPVYLGDSAAPGIKENISGIECITIFIMVHDGGSLKVSLPLGFVNSPGFETAMQDLEKLYFSKKSNTLFSRLKQAIGNESLNESVCSEIKQLCDNLIKMNRQHNPVNWLRIIKNHMLSARIKNVDLITGNPPWVKWEHLPEYYSDRLKKQCHEKHLFSGHGYMGAIQLNLCATIASISASQRLSDKGILSFLMPGTLLTQDSYDGFRNFYIDYKSNKRLYLYKIDDWSKAGSPFIYTAEAFATYYYGHRPIDYKKGIPVVFYKKKRAVPVEDINRSDSFAQAKKFFETSEGKAFQLGGKRTGFSVFKGNAGINDFSRILGECAYKARTGVEFTPAEVYRLSFIKNAPDNKTAYFENYELPYAVHKAKTSGTLLKLETDYIFPMVLSPDIRKYSLDHSGTYCLFPYYLEDGACYLLGSEEMKKNAPGIYEFFRKNRDVLNAQSKRSISMRRGNEPYALSKVGLYSFYDHAVAFRDNTCMSAVVLSAHKTEWGETKQFICAKHAPYISMDKNNVHISGDEAYYISAILNTDIVEQYYKATYSVRSYSIKNIEIYIPKYSEKNRYHSELSLLSHEAHDTESVVERNLIRHKIESLYIEMCRSENPS